MFRGSGLSKRVNFPIREEDEEDDEEENPLKFVRN
jgi:hypothetical protein